MKFLGWYSFVVMTIATLIWVPDFLTMSAEWGTGMGVIILFSPVVYYLFKKAKEEK